MSTIHPAHYSSRGHFRVGVQRVGAIADSVRGTSYLAEIAYRVTAFLYLLKPSFMSDIYVKTLYDTLVILSGTEIFNLKKKSFKKVDLVTENVEKSLLTLKTFIDLARGLHSLKIINIGFSSLVIGKVSFLPIRLMCTPIGITSEILQLTADLYGIGSKINRLIQALKVMNRLKIEKTDATKFIRYKKIRNQIIFQTIFKVTRAAMICTGLCLIIAAPQIGISFLPFLILGGIAYSIRLLEFVIFEVKNEPNRKRFLV